ncbi:MAG: hypothetical protein ACI9WS_003028 [Paraglaciecola psychrophila]|jgi:hypothetical protein
MSDQPLITVISDRIEDIYRRWAKGEDVPPALVFRTEGFIEAACLIQAVSAEEVLAVMETLHQQQFKRAMSGCGESPIRIHSTMQRAPVFTSTPQ